MARMTTERPDHLEFALWLIFDREGSVRLVRSNPALSRTERAVSLTAKMPKSLWETPSLRAELTVADNGQTTVDIQAVAEAVRLAIGVDIDIIVTD